MTIGVEAWQSQLSSHSMRLSHLLKTGDMSDITFVVGDHPEKKKFNLHKLVLSICSDVFSVMFYGSLPERNEVFLIDVTPRIFEITIKYVYEETFAVNSLDEAIKTYLLSDKYNITQLRDLCVDYIAKETTPSNLHLLFAIPNLFDESKLKLKCDRTMSECTSEIIKDENSFEWPIEMVLRMLQFNKLNVTNERQLFKFCLNWAVAKCGKENREAISNSLREIMDPLLPHIRFLAMAPVDFVKVVADSSILDDKEIACIVMNMIVSNCRALPSWCSTAKCRTKFVETASLCENCGCNNKYQMIDYVDSIECTMIVRRGSLLLRGVSFYLSFTASAKVTISVSRQGIELGAGGQTSYNQDTGVMKVYLTEPVTLKRLPSLPYIVSVCIHCEGISCTRGCNAEKRLFFLSPQRTFEIECQWKVYPTFTAQNTNFHFCEIIYSEYE